MPMLTVSLAAGTWYEVTELDDPEIAMVYVDSTDDVVAAFEAGEPASTSDAFACDAGINSYRIPYNKSLWLKLISGSANVTYSQFGGIMIDESKCAYGRSDTITIDEVITGAAPIVGFDDQTDPGNTTSHVGLLHTEAAGIAASATIESAMMTLRFRQFTNGRTIRLYGIEDDASITAGLSTYDTLAVDPPLTTAFVDVTLDNSGSATIDLTSVIQELVDDVSGWTTASPVQLWIGDIDGSPTSGNDETAAIFVQGRASALYVRAS